MEQTIKKILAIDREAEEHRKSMDQLLVTKKLELSNFIASFENEYNKETEKMKEELTKEKICEAEKIVSEIESSKSIELEKLNNLFKNHKDIIINEIFDYIISSN